MPRVTGLSLTADYWSVKRTNLLGQRSINDILANDSALLRAYATAQRAAGVAPDAADLAAFATFNAANPGNPAAPVGRVFSTNTPFVNFFSSEHMGVDFGLRYFLPRRGGGSG